MAERWNIDEKELPGKGVSAFEMFEKCRQVKSKRSFNVLKSCPVRAKCALDSASHQELVLLLPLIYLCLRQLRWQM